MISLPVIFLPGAPRSTGQQYPSSGVAGVPLGDNYNISVSILSNPFPSKIVWTFIDYNGTLYDELPDNVMISTQPGTHRLTIEAILNITNTQEHNYGNYTVTASNTYGNMTPILFSIQPRSEYVILINITIQQCRIKS
jgi:hypothetical protein